MMLTCVNKTVHACYLHVHVHVRTFSSFVYSETIFFPSSAVSFVYVSIACSLGIFKSTHLISTWPLTNIVP